MFFRALGLLGAPCPAVLLNLLSHPQTNTEGSPRDKQLFEWSGTPIPPTPTPTTVNTHFLYVSNGCHFPSWRCFGDGSLSDDALFPLCCCWQAILTRGLHCFALFCALIGIRTLVLLAYKYSTTTLSAGLFCEVERKDGSLQGRTGSQWMRAGRSKTKCQNSRGVNVYLTLQHLAFCDQIDI